MPNNPKSIFSLAMAAVIAVVGGVLPASVVRAAAATYYVSTSGDDANPGTSPSGPFRTINRCAQAMAPGDTCVIDSGTYRETVTPVNSGESGRPITFRAAPGATVIVSGTEPIGGWTPYNGNIYTADLAWSLGHENQLFIREGGAFTALWEARWPNIDAYSLPELKRAVGVADGGSATTLVDADLTQPDDYWKGATIWERGGDAYVGQSSKVTGFDSATHTLTYEPMPGNFDYMYPRLGTTYYLTGLLSELDAPHEWYVDEAAKKVYLWASAGGVPSGVEMKKRLTAFNLNQKSHIRIEGIRIFGANIQMNNANDNVLDGIQADYLYFSNKTTGTSVPHQLKNGIQIAGNNNVLKNSKVAYSSGTLVNIEGSNNRIVNNLIREGSYMASYDPLVKLSSGSSNLISHNEIRESGRYNIYWSRGSAEIQYNDISNGMWLSRDGALIYSWGTDMGNSEIHHNWIHDSKGTDMSVGLYFDNYTANAVVHHNLIYNNDVGIQLNTPGNYKLIYNNTVVNNPRSGLGYWGSAPYDKELYGTRVFNNIFTNPVSFTPDTANGFNTLSEAGVKFANPAANDYRLTPGSTAINTGAVIPGITDDYVGAAPDAGAYEYGGPDWTAGPDFANPPDPQPSPINTPYMNLVKNSGFSGSLDDWLKWSVDTTTFVQVPVSGEKWEKRGYQTKLRLGKGGGVEQKVTGLKPDTEYKFVAWVYNEPGEAIQIGVLNYGGTAIDISSKDTTYTRHEVVFRTGATNTDARVRIYKSNAATGFSYADDVGLFEITPFDPGVSQSLLKEVSLGAPSVIVTEEDQGTFDLTGTLQNGKPADLSSAEIEFTSSDASVLRIDVGNRADASYTALAPGQVTIRATATKDGVTKAATQTVTVFPRQPQPGGTEWTVRAYGANGQGFVTEKDGVYSFVGMGDNVWNVSDDFVYLSKLVELADPKTKVTLTATIDSFGSPDPASVGLMIRDRDTADSKHVHFRVDGTGQILRYVFRNEESILDAQKPPDQQKYWGSATGLLLDYAGKSMTAPFRLKLVKEGDTVSGYYFKDGAWLSIGSTTVEFSGNRFLAGIGMYAGKEKPPVKAVISNLEVQIDRTLAQVDLTADKTTLAPGASAVLSVGGRLSDGSPADLSQASIVYASDRPDVVTVDASGRATAIGEGTAQVRVTVTAGGTTLEDGLTLTVDASAPVTAAAVDKPGTNGWYGSDATVSLTATDTLSGVERTEYLLGEDGEWTLYTAPLTLTDEGVHRVQYRSVDKAGNAEAAKTIEIRLDKTGPVLSVKPDRTSIWPANHKMVTVQAAVYASDSASGVASVVLTSVASSEPASAGNDIRASVGTNATAFELRAEKGRVYTVTYTATDRAGNRTDATAVIVVPHDQSGKSGGVDGESDRSPPSE
ncbi:OmpL47-type beta-barrel domain-containing protein [Paenibacillus flagellatus]|uniref:BIG2 domain-containing protein n=1 Tax=Paenibacillus flagellatus TaxID=2211139 RepID=A0A2V5K2Y6_9BACL|nr:Ig-like domain-containing protein [Paenibacillus flagellatus]PYI51933.1 hypothetical protein DLM86_23790 [Paenibacillus flagellatus]